MSTLPPDPLPALVEPDGTEGIYARSRLRTVTGTRINPKAKPIYDQRLLCLSPACPVKTAAHPLMARWLEEVGGFDARAQVRQPTADQWEISRVIPRVRAARSFPPFPIPVGTYAVDYQDLNASPQHLPQRAWISSLRSKFPAGSTLILDFLGNHELVESVWTFGDEFFAHEICDQFDALVVPEFSTFANDPTPQWLIGERMKQMWMTDGTRAGRTIIPSLAWSTEDSLRRQVDLIGSFAPERISTVFLDLLGVGVNRVQWLWSRLEMVEKHLAHLPVRFLVVGATAGWAIAELHAIFPRGNFHIVAAGPFMEALRYSGTPQAKADKFRYEVERLEQLARGEGLPARKARPGSDSPDDAPADDA